MISTAQRPRLTAEDRCDRCGAQAYVQVELYQGAELLFCGHHAREYDLALREVAIMIHDETNLLDAEPRGVSRPLRGTSTTV